MDDEYLSPDEQEFNLIDNDINGNPQECDDKELLFDGKEELSRLIETLKNTIQVVVFQQGTTKQVHNPSVLTNYKTLLKIIYDLLINFMVNKTIPMDVTDNPEIQQNYKLVLEHLQKYNQESDSQNRKEFLKLHLICFPYCQRENCLSMD